MKVGGAAPAGGCTEPLSAPRPPGHRGEAQGLSVTHEPQEYIFSASFSPYLEGVKLTGSSGAGVSVEGGRVEGLGLMVLPQRPDASPFRDAA